MSNNLSILQGSNLEDLIELDAIESVRANRDEFSVYEYNGIKVPRVTKIIDSLFDKSFLIQWAINFNNKYAYLNEKNFITDVGTKTHNMIEEFLKTGEEQEAPYKKAPRQAPVIQKAYDNFRDWYDRLISNGNSFEVIGIEVPVVNPFYGGCIDCIAKINGAYYILDFKTSKKISYEYIIQTCAYMWTINNGYTDLPHISGIGIIRVSKESTFFEDLFLNEFIPEQNKILNDYIRGFGALLNAYYEKINMEYQFNQYKKSYPGLFEIIK